ncbi:dipeptidyl aminopeptidase/acylaminoacyl peptidase [Krasilnikovia cinnamomea]|uniref:Dipeptidyl aminopeptidase/acylaminoacyl peptidase n=1 Tax=Krasilnikovia cinnamomea TaxID=349313 RepID=A0A4Q7ZET8_9ACTN|nr:S9 family peptidase [Krasilnikovia cinnamomea]RZU49262.1 dipeptidyl aminopeptidase/acylaminoacyl peptidase [Krasilnikovia cinnamomea]
MTGQLDGAVLPVAGITSPVSEVAGCWSPALSPDGRHAAYVSDRGGTPQVWVQPIGSDLAFVIDTGGEPVAAVHWSTDGDWLACQVSPGGAPRHEVWLVRPDGSASHQVAGFGADTADAIRWLPGRPLLAVTENLSRALLVDAGTGQRHVVAEGELIALLDVSPDHGRALLRRGPRGARRLVVRDLHSGLERYVTQGQQGCFGPDGHSVYAVSDAGEFPVLIRWPSYGGEVAAGTGPGNVADAAGVVADAAGVVTDAAGVVADARPGQVADGVEVVADAGRGEVESFALTVDGRTVAVLWNVRGGESELALLDLAHDGRRVVDPLPGSVVGGLAWSADGRTLAFTAEGPGQPHGVWTCPVEGQPLPVAVEPGALELFGIGDGDSVTRPGGSSGRDRLRAAEADAPHPAGAGASPAQRGTARPVLHTLRSHDGLEITGWLLRPAGDGPHPAVLWLHGGPEAQERPGHNPLFQSLVNRGVAVFAPNVRGSSGFGRSFVAADNGPLRYAAIADVAACVNYLVTAGIADPARVGCAGRSYGGYLTLAALTRYPELFAVGVDVCGMSNFATFYAHTEPWIAAAAVTKYGDPVADAELLRDLSPITRIDRLRAPLLVVHGANDSNVPVIESEQVVAALAERGVPHHYLLFPGEGHELLHRAARAEYLRVTTDWLAKHLQAHVLTS